MAEQAADHRLLAVGDGPQHEGEFDVGSQLDQAEFADLRERPIATRPGRGPAEGGGVGVRVGDVIDRPIEPHELEPAVEGPGRLGLGQGMNELLKQAADRGDAQTLSGHAQAGPMRGLLAEAKPACVLEDLADRQFGQDSHGQHHPADDFVGQHTTALIGSAGVRKHLANGLGRDNLFQSRQSIQEPARRIGRQRALSWLHRSHSLLGTLLVPKPKITRGRDLRLFQRYWGYVASQIMDLEAGSRQHDADQVLADVVGITLDHADDYPAFLPLGAVRDVRLEHIHPRVHRVRGQENLRNEVHLILKELAGSLHAMRQSMVNRLVCVEALRDDLL